MSSIGGPNISKDGLVVVLDPDNQKSLEPDFNLINPNVWTVGLGSVSGFGLNGNSTENYRVIGDDPFGNQVVIWEARPDSASGADGGWNTSSFIIDNTKMYRFSVWVRRNSNSNGRFYLGTRGYGSVNGVLNRSNNSNNTNPYFWNDINFFTPDIWYLVVGHVWPVNSGSGALHSDSGIYNIESGRVGNINSDFIWRAETTTSLHRSYLFYGTDTSQRQQWVYPRVDIIDGTEPSISDLLQNKVNDIYIRDITGNGNNAVRINNVSASIQNNKKRFDMDGVDTSINISYDLRSSWSFECWVLHNTINGFSFLGQGSSAISSGLHIWFNSNNSLRFGMYSNDMDVNNLTTNTGVWYHYVFTYNHNSPYQKQVYRNGVLLSGTNVQTQSQYLGTGVVRIGSTYSSGGSYANGNFSKIKFYNRVIIEDEVIRNFNSSRKKFL